MGILPMLVMAGTAMPRRYPTKTLPLALLPNPLLPRILTATILS